MPRGHPVGEDADVYLVRRDREPCHGAAGTKRLVVGMRGDCQDPHGDASVVSEVDPVDRLAGVGVDGSSPGPPPVARLPGDPAWSLRKKAASTATVVR